MNSGGVVNGGKSVDDSHSTTCPYCGDPLTGRQRKKCGKPECKRAFNAARNGPFAKAWRDKLRAQGLKRRPSNCYEHVCLVCGRAFRSHKQEQGHCSVECWRTGQGETQAEKKRQKRLPILHPGPYSWLPVHHPAMQKTRRFIAGTCQICGVGFITAHVRHATCGSEYCVTEKRRAERRSRKAYERSLERGGRPGVFSGSQWGARLREYDRCCAYCGSTEDIQIEHVIPVGRNGANCIANVVPACAACNSEKSWRTPQEWKASGNKRVSTLDDSHWPTGAREAAAAR